MAISRELMFEVLFKIFHDRVKPVRQRGEHDIEVFLQYALACFDDLLGYLCGARTFTVRPLACQRRPAEFTDRFLHGKGEAGLKNLS